MKQFIDKSKDENLEYGVDYFATGLVLEEYPDTPSGKEVTVGFINPFGEYVCEWRARNDIIMSEISDSDANILEMAFKRARYKHNNKFCKTI